VSPAPLHGLCALTPPAGIFLYLALVMIIPELYRAQAILNEQVHPRAKQRRLAVMAWTVVGIVIMGLLTLMPHSHGHSESGGGGHAH
jgi:hypothetical protein